MSRVDWINWKTDPKEILNPDTVIANLEDKYRTYHTYMNSVVTESISHEIQFGGLDQNSFTLEGVAPAYEKARIILKHIEDIAPKMEQFKADIKREAEQQKQVEKKQLIECIEEKLLEEEKILNNTISLKEKAQNNTYISMDEVEDSIENTTQRIRRLKERLELAQRI